MLPVEVIKLTEIKEFNQYELMLTNQTPIQPKFFIEKRKILDDLKMELKQKKIENSIRKVSFTTYQFYGK